MLAGQQVDLVGSQADVLVSSVPAIVNGSHAGHPLNETLKWKIGKVRIATAQRTGGRAGTYGGVVVGSFRDVGVPWLLLLLLGLQRGMQH